VQVAPSSPHIVLPPTMKWLQLALYRAVRELAINIATGR
jgi:hypothetical protein